MSETYVPHPGDRVRFYSWAAQMDLLGEVLSVAPQARMATVREDNEEGQTFIKSWDVLRPFPRADRLARSLADVAKALQDRTEERDEANTRAASWWEAAKDMTRNYYAVSESAQLTWDRNEELEREVASLKTRLNSVANERNLWADNSGRQAARARIAENRAEKAEADLARFHGVLVPQRDLDEMTEARDYWKNRAEITHLQHVAANKRADDLEADRDGWVKEAADNQYISRMGYEERDEARARVKELEADLAHARAAGEALRRRVEKHNAETWTDHDGTVRNLGGITRAELAQKLYDENERAGREKARAEKAEQLLAEARVGWKTSDDAANAAEARIEELEDQNRQLKSVLDRTNEDVTHWRQRFYTSEADFEAQSGHLRTWSTLAGERLDEITELKAALRTLGGESK